MPVGGHRRGPSKLLVTVRSLSAGTLNVWTLGSTNRRGVAVGHDRGHVGGRQHVVVVDLPGADLAQEANHGVAVDVVLCDPVAEGKPRTQPRREVMLSTE